MLKSKLLVRIICLMFLVLLVLGCGAKALEKGVLDNAKVAFLYKYKYEMGTRGAFAWAVKKHKEKAEFKELHAKYNDDLKKAIISINKAGLESTGIPSLKLKDMDFYNIKDLKGEDAEASIRKLAAKGYTHVVYADIFNIFNIHISKTGTHKLIFIYKFKIVDARKPNVTYFDIEFDDRNVFFEDKKEKRYHEDLIYRKGRDSYYFQTFYALLKYFSKHIYNFMKTKQSPDVKENFSAGPLMKKMDTFPETKES